MISNERRMRNLDGANKYRPKLPTIVVLQWYLTASRTRSLEVEETELTLLQTTVVQLCSDHRRE